MLQSTNEHKAQFRRTKKWKDFRKNLIKEQKFDPVTQSRLTKKANCHHLCLKDEEYEILSETRQVMLNPTTHDMIHFLFRTKDWRKALEETKKILERMEELNK